MEGERFRAPLVGERVGRYQVETKWRAGPFGPTARGRLVASPRSVALHALCGVLPTLDDSALSARIAKLRRVPSPRVEQPFDLWRVGADTYAAFELPDAEEPPLTSLPSRGRFVGATLPLEIARRVGIALAPLHDAGFAHGLLCAEAVSAGGARMELVRIEGFGLAEVLDSAARARVAGVALGAYFAPEICEGGASSPRADVFAIGVLLYELLAGSRPFAGATQAALFAAIREGRVADLDADPAVCALVAQLLHPDPAQRPAHGSEVAHAIAALAPSRASRARGASPSAEAETSSGAEPSEPRATEREATARTSAREESARTSAREESARTSAREESARTSAREESARTSARESPASVSGAVPRFTGALAREQLACARRQYGEDVVRRALDALDQETRDEVAGATAVSWVRVDAFSRFHDALAAALGRSVESTHPELVRAGSQRTFNSVWRLLLRVGGTKLVMTRAPVVYSKTYDTGVMTSQSVTETGGTFALTGWPAVPEFVLRGLRAGITVALENVGRVNVHLDSQRTADGALFTASWDR